MGRERYKDRVKGMNVFSGALSFSLIYFNYFTRHTHNDVKKRGKWSLHFNKVGVKSHKSKNEDEIIIRDWERAPNSQ